MTKKRLISSSATAPGQDKLWDSLRQEFINPMDDAPRVMGDEELKTGEHHFCQAMSPDDEPCDRLATVRCTRCGRWFCDTHADDEEWHSCALPPGEEGGEA